MPFCRSCQHNITRSMAVKTVTQQLIGGWTCPHCGATIDWLGRVTAAPLPGSLPKTVFPKQSTIRLKVALIGALVAPVVLLIVYGILAGDRVFLDLPTDRPMTFLSALVGVPFVLMLPFNVWLRVLVVVLYLPIILAVLVIVAGNIACGYGRCL